MLFSVLDTETTGLNLNRHEIIQVGLIEYEISDQGDLRLIWEHDHKIIPTNIATADPKALKINGYHPKR